MPEPTPDDTRAARAFETYFAERARGADFPPLDPAALAVRRPHRRPLVFGLAAAAAVLALVVGSIALFGSGGAVSPGVVPAAPASAARTPGSWQKTPAIPVGQRYRAISLWAGNGFYILGGISHCGRDAQGLPTGGVCPASLPSRGAPLADGARYDPATDTWTRIADAPLTIGGGQGVVVGNAIYVLPEDLDDSTSPLVLRYDTGADRWSRLPQPSDSSVRQLFTWGDELYAATVRTGCATQCEAIDRWDEASAAWRAYAPSHPALAADRGTLTAAGAGVVGLYRTADRSALSAAAFTDGGWRALPDPPFADAWWLGAARDVVVAVAQERAYALDLGEGVWRRLPESPSAGGLTGAEPMLGVRLVDGKHVVIDGQLYDPAAGEWTTVPALPNPGWMFGAFASNGTQLLGCFVGAEGSMNDCYLLVLGSPIPAGAAVRTNTWVETAAVPLDRRRDAIAAWVGDEFVILGGRICQDPAITGTCPAAVTPDGAAYRPDTDHWRRIATPPDRVDTSASWAVLGGSLYVLTASQGFWAYDAGADRWRELPALVGGGDRPAQLIAVGDLLLALSDWPRADAYFDPSTARWTELPAGTYPNADYAGGARRIGAFTGKELLIGTPNGGGSYTFTLFWLDPDGKRATTPGSASDPVPGSFPAPARLVVTDSATIVILPTATDGKSAYRIGGGGAWEPGPAAGSDAGPLVPGLVAGSLVSVGGSLFDPDTPAWHSLPGLPDGESVAAVQAGAPGSVLSCFSVTPEDTLNGKCYLLRS